MFQKKQKEENHNSNQDTACPFDLAKYLDIKVTYFEFPDNIYGYYTPMLSTQHIVINTRICPEFQEKVCDHLIAHHILHSNVQVCIDEEIFEQLENKNNFSQYMFLLKKLKLSFV